MNFNYKNLNYIVHFTYVNTMLFVYKLLTSPIFKKRLNCIVGRYISVLGIETSCDDTGIAIVSHKDNENQVLANVLHSQQSFHIRYGGIIPNRAQDLHRAEIEGVFEMCLLRANMSPNQLDAIAVTTRPGLPLSLLVGLRFARYIARKYKKPLIPIHHMEAHALQARMEHNIPYPYLCLLISGGHCQLTFVRSASEFLLLGETLDDAPGEALDKIARLLRLYINPVYRKWNGGQIVEDAAKLSTKSDTFYFPLPLARQRDCNFSFAGIKNASHRAIKFQEKIEGTPPDSVIKEYANFCADLLNATSRHLMNRSQRALEFCLEHHYFLQHLPRSMVVSGGVANNDKIFRDIAHVAQHYDCQTFRPSKGYCSDNGVMIAWNGIEHIIGKSGRDCLRWDYDNIDVVGTAPLGVNIVKDVLEADIKCKWIQMQRNYI